MMLNSKVALVTGAAQGIGKVIAMKLVGEGAAVAITDLNMERLSDTAREIEDAGGKVLALEANVAVMDEVQGVVQETVNRFGGIHILVNNAGITKDALLLRMTEDDWDKVIAVNLKGVFNCTRTVLKVMSKQRYGRMVNIASIVGEMGNAGQANYAASKAGVIGFTKTVAREYAKRGITANAVAPGFIVTAMTEAMPEKAREALIEQIPMGSLGSAEDVANAVFFLVSEDSSYITGQVLNINGGMYM
ncbi:MAG: 3-oxoacyl-[acyl-carrier-protein] reductase [Thermodesulfobacteriota bacterium]